MASITLRAWLRPFESVIYTSKRNNEIPEFKMHSCSADTNNPDARALNLFKFFLNHTHKNFRVKNVDKKIQLTYFPV